VLVRGAGMVDCDRRASGFFPAASELLGARAGARGATLCHCPRQSRLRGAASGRLSSEGEQGRAWRVWRRADRRGRRRRGVVFDGARAETERERGGQRLTSCCCGDAPGDGGSAGAGAPERAPRRTRAGRAHGGAPGLHLACGAFSGERGVRGGKNELSFWFFLCVWRGGRACVCVTQRSALNSEEQATNQSLQRCVRDRDRGCARRSGSRSSLPCIRELARAAPVRRPRPEAFVAREATAADGRR
jgi:hypothetical protein